MKPVSEDGTLAKSIKSTAKVAQTEVTKNKTLAAISKVSGENVANVASHLCDSKIPLEDVRDITSEVLAPRLAHGPDMATSQVVVYKGIVKALQEQRQRHIAVFAGSNDIVLDAIVGDSVEQIINNQQVKLQWEHRGYKPLGIAVLRALPDANKQPQAFFDDLCAMSAASDSTVVLMVFRSTTTDPELYDLPSLSSDTGSSTDNERKLIPAINSGMNGNKKKGCNYRVLLVEKVGVTLEDETISLVHAAIREHVLQQVDKQTAEPHDSNPTETMPMVLKCVPADGKCFFHAVKSSIHFQQYQAVPRRTSGFAVNSRQVALEEQEAIDLIESVVEKVNHTNDHDCAVAAALSESSGVVDVRWIPFIARQLGLGIRCTIAPEARTRIF